MKTFLCTLTVTFIALAGWRTGYAQPANNNFANAITLTGVTVTTIGSNVGANKEFREPNHGGNNGGASVWWNWTAPASGLTTIDTSGSSFNTLLGVYTGNSVNTLTTIAGNDDYNGNTWSRVQFTAVAGTLYHIAVDGFRVGGFGNVAAQGSIVLNIQGAVGVTISSPTNGMQFITGDAIPISVTISTNFPNPPPSRVDFFRGGVLFASSSNAPFNIVATNVPPGSNTLTALAFDSIGQSYLSPPVTIGVLSVGVTIVSPADGASFANTNPIPVSVVAFIPQGNFTMTEVDFYVDGQKFGQVTASPFNATWTNVTAGAHKLTATGADNDGGTYVSTPVFISVASTIVQSNSVWKYLDTGVTNLGSAWVAQGFDDSSWASGPAPLGYGDANGHFPATTNGYGADPTNRYITTYYRRSFTLTNATNFTGHTLRVQRDDGIVVYLNGGEVYRQNMPTGEVTSTTYASTAIGGTDETTWYSTNLSSQAFQEGNNVFAVEIHQSDPASADLWFDLNVVGQPLIIRNRAPLVQFTSPSNGATFFAPASIILTANASDTDGAVTRVEFYADDAKLGQTNNGLASFVWNNPAVGWHVLQAVATDNEGASTASTPITIIVFNATGTPLAQITNPPNAAVFYGPTNITIGAIAAAGNGITNVQFNANGAPIGNAITSPYFMVWTNAPYGTNSLTAIAFDSNGVTTTSAVVRIAVLTNDPPVVALISPTNGSSYLGPTNIVLAAFASDGQGVAKVEYYANATRIGQATASPYSYAWNNVAIGSYQLQAVATDIYGLAGTSSVVNIILTNDAPPVAAITSPTSGTPFNTPASVLIVASASDIDGSISKVEFFANGAKVGESTNQSFSFLWTNVLATGSIPLYVVATDNLGFRGTSAVVNITITALVSPQWTAFNDQNQGPASNPNDTYYTATGFGTTSGALKDSYTGAILPVSVTITNVPGIANAATMSAPAAGTPASKVFSAFIDWNSGTGQNVANGFNIYPTNVIGYRFTGLDPHQQYTFIATAIRGGTTPTSGNEYSNRWTQAELVGALSYVSAHSSNVLTSVQYPGVLTGSQAAWNSGINSTPNTGDIIEWDNISPAADGSFTILCRKYLGPIPGGSAANSLYGYAFSAMKLGIAPFGIASQPQSLTITPGDTATFTVGAAGSPPLFYQWLKDGANITGATNKTYSIVNASSTDEGTYSVVVSNLTASATSSNAILTVGYYPVVITAQPQSQTANEGSAVVLSVGVSGALPYFFEWFKDGNVISGATNQSFTIASASTADAGDYFVVVSDRFSDAISSEANVSVFSPSSPGVTVMGFNDHWRYDQSGTDLGTAWKESAFDDSSMPLGQGVFIQSSVVIPEEGNTVLSLTAASGSVTSYYFRTHFTWPYPTTNVFLITSNLLDDGAVYYLNGAEAARLRVAPGAVTYQTLATSSPNNGTNYEMLNLQSGALLYGDNVLAVEVHQATVGAAADVVFGLSLKGIAKNSEPVRVAVGPVDETVNEGMSASFTGDVFGTPPITFQWYQDGQPVAGATNQTLVLPTVHGINAGVYSFVAANRFNSAQSGGARLTVIADTTPPFIKTVVANDLSTVVVTFSEPLDPASAVNPANYSFSPALTISGIQVVNPTTVVLTTSPRDPQFDYSLSAPGVLDTALPSNAVGAGHPVAIHRRNSATIGGLAGIQTVFLIIFENEDWSNIEGSPNAPYMNSLLSQASYCEQYHAHSNQHPSEPNYIFLEAGTNFGFTDDSGPSVDRLTSTNHFVTQLKNANIDWRGYMESMPVGSTGTADSGEYVGRHDPFAFFNDVTTDYNYATNHIRPYSYFAGDLAANQIGRYNWITPNLTNDMHDLAPGSTSAVRQGDNWLAQELPRILNSASYSNNGLVILTFDESNASTTSPIMMVVLSPLAKGGGYVTSNFYDHSSTVRTLQDIFGVGPYLGDAANATNLGELFKDLKISGGYLSGGQYQFSLTNFVVGQNYYIQASADLASWTTVSTNLATTGSMSFPDANAVNYTYRFYRAIQAP